MKMDAWKSISISIHTLHTEGDTLTIHYMDDTDISIHTLHTEGDHGAELDQARDWVFQSTPSTRRVTTVSDAPLSSTLISIHTLHTEGDLATWIKDFVSQNFNPHPPHGG